MPFIKQFDGYRIPLLFRQPRAYPPTCLHLPHTPTFKMTHYPIPRGQLRAYPLDFKWGPEPGHARGSGIRQSIAQLLPNWEMPTPICGVFSAEIAHKRQGIRWGFVFGVRSTICLQKIPSPW